MYRYFCLHFFIFLFFCLFFCFLFFVFVSISSGPPGRGSGSHGPPGTAPRFDPYGPQPGMGE
jgi:hypothetical protein